jgi:hypothetical protein
LWSSFCERKGIISGWQPANAGEKDLIEFTPGERQKAKARLDKIRAKRRERHARKKGHNWQDKI